MKLYSKLSALGAVLVLTTAFASADTVHYFTSGSGSVGFVGYSTTPGGPFAIQPAGTNNSTGTSATFGILPGTDWAPALVGADSVASIWVSYDQFSGPTGGETDATYDWNGYYEYTTNFNFQHSSYGEITVAADDTVAIYLNGVNILPLGAIGGDAHCADGYPELPPRRDLHGLLQRAGRFQCSGFRGGSDRFDTIKVWTMSRPSRKLQSQTLSCCWEPACLALPAPCSARCARFNVERSIRRVPGAPALCSASAFVVSASVKKLFTLAFFLVRGQTGGVDRLSLQISRWQG